MIPIAVEGGKGTRKQNTNFTRRGSTSFGKKPIQRKGSRQKLKTIQVEIQLEAATSAGTSEKSPFTRPQPARKKSMEGYMRPRDNCRKSAVSTRNGIIPSKTTGPVRKKSTSDIRDVQRVFNRRQSSSRDLGLGQGSSGIKKMLSRRQSSCKDLLGLDKRRKSHGKVVIRRDSVNGLRIVTKNIDDIDNSVNEEHSDENDAIEKLSAISLEEIKEFTKFEVDALNAHNKYRKRHTVPPLELSKDLCDVAQEYANHLARTNTFEHSGDPVYGENLYWSWSSDPGWVLTGDEPVDSWYDEKKGYNYGREPRDSESGHFTQLVWAKSLHLGVGVTTSSSSGKYIVVMKYDPVGN